jgi:hypothetical protein
VLKLQRKAAGARLAGVDLDAVAAVVHHAHHIPAGQQKKESRVKG